MNHISSTDRIVNIIVILESRWQHFKSQPKGYKLKE